MSGRFDAAIREFLHVTPPTDRPEGRLDRLDGVGLPPGPAAPAAPDVAEAIPAPPEPDQPGPAQAEAPVPHPWHSPALDPVTVSEVVGPDPSPVEIEMVQHEVAAAIVQLRFEMLEARVHPWPRLVFGRPLADWLSLDTVAGLLRDFDRATGGQA